MTEIFSEIIASSKTVGRKIPCKITYKAGDKRQLEIDCKNVQVKEYRDACMKATANCDGLQVQFGRTGQVQYQVNASAQIEDQGKRLRLQTWWTEVTAVATRTSCNSLHCVLLPFLFQESFVLILCLYLVSGYDGQASHRVGNSNIICVHLVHWLKKPGKLRSGVVDCLCLAGEFILSTSCAILTKVANGSCLARGGVLPYMSYIGSCHYEGYGFQRIYSRIAYRNQRILF